MRDKFDPLAPLGLPDSPSRLEWWVTCTCSGLVLFGLFAYAAGWLS